MTGLLDSLPLRRALFRIILCCLLFIVAAPASQEELGSWLEQGHSALENGSYREAVNFFDQAIKIDGGNASAWGGKGAALSRLGRYKMAEMCLGMALKKEDKNPNYWLEDGRAKELGERWSEAIESYERALSLNKSLAHAWLGLANSSLALKEYEYAKQLYRNAQGQGLAQSGREGLLNALLAGGQDALDRGSFNEAYSISSEALALAPQDVRFMEMRCSALVGNNEVEEALSCYDQMQSAGQSSGQAIVARSLLLTLLGKRELSAGNISLALERLKEALRLDPHNQDAIQFQAKALSQKGDLLFEQGKYDLARESFDAALDVYSGEISAQEGKRKTMDFLTASRNDNGSADPALEEGLERGSLPEEKPESSDSARHLEQAKEYMNRGSITLALESINRSLEMDPGQEDAWLLKAEILFSLGNDSQSLAAVDRALEINQTGLRSQALKGRVLLALGRYKMAGLFLDLALRQNPENISLWMDKALAQEKLENYQGALKSYEEALREDDNNTGVLLAKGELLLKMKEYREALQCFSFVLEKDKDDAAAWRVK